MATLIKFTFFQDKGFIKATKKHAKDYETLLKKQAKERLTIQTNQCKAIEKVAKSKK